MELQAESTTIIAPKSEGTKKKSATRPRESFLQFIARATRELQHVKFALASFVINNLRRRYRRSILGFAWSLLNPLLTMVVLTTVFSLLFHRNAQNYAVFVFTGLLPWQFLSDSIINGGISIVQNEHFLKKVYIPKTFFPLVAVGTEGVNFALSLSSMLILGLFIGLHPSPTLLLVPLAVAVLTVFNLAMAIALSILTIYFRDLTHIIKIVLSAAFYLVPIIYPLDQIPAQFRSYFFLNPIYYFINLFRVTINDGRLPTAPEWLIPVGVASLAMAASLYMMYKTERDLIYRL
ncbi:MAG TPA: ABC transporter permease [Planktothrix sp.]|jgi:ABC-2 type transport system permease protein/lipopolysaccharide transport system permease protein